MIVKLALLKVREALKTIIKVSLYGRSSQIADIVDVNLLSLALKFMNKTNKLSSLLGEVTELLSDSQRRDLAGVPELNNIFEEEDPIGYWSVEDKFENTYFRYLYPTARSIEALAPREPPKPLLRNGINFIYGWMKKVGINEMTHGKSKYVVPIIQAAISTAENSRGKTKRKAEEIIEQAAEFSTTKDLKDDIYAQTIRYSYFVYDNHVLEKEELEPLIQNLNSGIFRRMMKGLEFLSALTFDLRQNPTNRILDMLPKFRKQIFDIVREGEGAIYFASVSESMRNTLQSYHNKTFARSFFNLMVEESSWISQQIFHPLHICKVLVGTSLLIFSRGALRR